jgi:MSHA biogenesis protein MshI
MIDSIVLEVQRSLDYYESNFSQPTPALLALAPLEFPCPELLAALSQNFGNRAKPFPLDTLLTGMELAEDEQARSFLAIGAALRREVAG